MTNEEAKVFMLQFNTDKRLNSSEHEAVRMAIKALEQEPCNDAISRQAAIDCLNADFTIDGKENMETVVDYINGAFKQIKALPSITPQQKIGYWTRELIINEYGGCIGAKMICSECGQDNGYDKRMKFCPNCGAKMEVEE